jgi:hypothetical protein
MFIGVNLSLRLMSLRKCLHEDSLMFVTNSTRKCKMSICGNVGTLWRTLSINVHWIVDLPLQLNVGTLWRTLSINVHWIVDLPLRLMSLRKCLHEDSLMFVTNSTWKCLSGVNVGTLWRTLSINVHWIVDLPLRLMLWRGKLICPAVELWTASSAVIISVRVADLRTRRFERAPRNPKILRSDWLNPTFSEYLLTSFLNVPGLP